VSLELQCIGPGNERCHVTANDGVFALAAEHRYVLQGEPDEIAAARADLANVIETALPEALVLGFGNAVGVFRVAHVGILVVRSRKWGADHFESMLEDIARTSAALPFAVHGVGMFPYERTIGTDPDLLYHAFCYLRHALEPTAGRTDLGAAFEIILSTPHRTATSETVMVAAERLRTISASAVDALASANGQLLRVSAERIAPSLRGYIPANLPEQRTVFTLDTPENRFARATLELGLRIVQRMRLAAQNLNRNSAFGARLLKECEAMHQVLEAFARHRAWSEVSPLRAIPGNSTVLQRRRGYRDVYRHYQRLHATTRNLPLSEHAVRELIEGRDIALLYEVWCFFRVIDALEALLGRASEAVTTDASEFERSLGRSCSVRWSCGTRAVYNATFRRGGKAPFESTSVTLRPDIAIITADGAVHLLDAKFRLEHIPNPDEVDGRGRTKNDDLCKMHTYRDALPAVRTAFVLYPGTERLVFRSHESRGHGAVGAVPLRPDSSGSEDLTAHLRVLLSRERAAVGPSVSLP
jgi:predicted component of viral defense system (DUF524 family)